MKSILIVFMMLLLGGCEDVNTFCPKDTNESNSTDNNCSDMNSTECRDYCSKINWSDINDTNTTCFFDCNCSFPKPMPDCKEGDYDYCKIITDDQNNSNFLCSDNLDFNSTCNFSGCDCNAVDYSHSRGVIGFGCECPGDSKPPDPDPEIKPFSDCDCSDCNSLGLDNNSSECSNCSCLGQKVPLSDCICSDCNQTGSDQKCSFCTCLVGTQNTSLDLIASASPSSIPYYNSVSGSNSDSSSNSDSRSSSASNPESDSSKSYINHTDIKAGLFWIGRDDNNYSIASSAWDRNWMDNYGGIDVPDNRKGYHPAGFTPDENPFYVALPYNDLGRDGERKYGADNYIPWITEEDDLYESICKNRWVKITANKITAYAQWEDVGPYGYSTDINYVFGGKEPLNHNVTNGSGIAISPAVRDFLSLDVNNTKIDWVFVEEANIPSGPWKEIVTNRPSN